MTYLEGMDQQALNPNLDTYFLNQYINSVDSSMVNAMVTYKLSLVYSLQNLEKKSGKLRQMEMRKCKRSHQFFHTRKILL